MQNHENPATWQRKLPFEDNDLWPMLPEPVRENCRTLWKELLASVLKQKEGRLNERED